MIIYLYNQKDSPYLIPCYDSDLECKKQLKFDTFYKVDIKPARDLGKHKRFFALLKLAWENLPHRLDGMYPDYENKFRKAVQLLAGHVEVIILPSGEVREEAASINFESMDDIEFNKLYKKCVNVILTHFINGIDEQHISDHISEYF